MLKVVKKCFCDNFAVLNYITKIRTFLLLWPFIKQKNQKQNKKTLNRKKYSRVVVSIRQYQLING